MSNKAIPVELPVILQGELLPCPFCGEQPEFAEYDHIGYYHCRNVDCGNYASIVHHYKWNNRPKCEPKSE